MSKRNKKQDVNKLLVNSLDKYVDVIVIGIKGEKAEDLLIDANTTLTDEVAMAILTGIVKA